MLSNNTWGLIPCPFGANIITGKWIFHYKFNVDGSLDKYKASWVVYGFTQPSDVDYDETFECSGQACECSYCSIPNSLSKLVGSLG